MSRPSLAKFKKVAPLGYINCILACILTIVLSFIVT